jgi:hypothetical protein
MGHYMGCAVSVSFSAFPGIEVNTVNPKTSGKNYNKGKSNL